MLFSNLRQQCFFKMTVNCRNAEKLRHNIHVILLHTYFSLKTSQTALLFYKHIVKCEFYQSACL